MVIFFGHVKIMARLKVDRCPNSKHDEEKTEAVREKSVERGGIHAVKQVGYKTFAGIWAIAAITIQCVSVAVSALCVFFLKDILPKCIYPRLFADPLTFVARRKQVTDALSEVGIEVGAHRGRYRASPT